MSAAKQYLIVGISGTTNSGKSSLARMLCSALPHTQSMCQDDYFLEPDDPRVERDEDGMQDWDRLSALDMDRMVKDVQQWTKTSFQDKNQKHILIIEGFLIFNHSILCDMIDKKFFIKISKDICEKRRLTRVYNPPDPPGYFEKTVWPNYVKHLDALQDVPGIEYINGMTDMQTMTQTVLTSIKSALQEEARDTDAEKSKA